MPEDKIILAIFDFDGTLTEGHLWKGMDKYFKAKKMKRLTLFFYLASHMPFWLASKFKLYSEEKNRSEWGEDLAVLFKGLSREKSKEIFEWVTDNYFLPLMRQDVLRLLKDHQTQGHKIVLLSGMFIDFLKAVGSKLGVDYVQGTRLEINNNYYSGKIIQPLCFGPNKAILLKEMIKEQNLNVDLRNSYAYADSYYDMSVFDLVGNPVATYPDKKLTQIAIANQWRMISSG